MKRSIYLIICFLFLKVSAQDSTSVSYSGTLNAGIQSMVLKDLYRSPYVYRGVNTLLTLDVARTSKRGFQALEAGYGFGHVKSSFSPKAVDHTMYLNYKYLWKIRSGAKQDFCLGPQFVGQAWQVNYFPDMKVPDYSRVHTYMVGLSLGLGLQYRYKISNRSGLALALSLPLLNYVERPSFMDGNTPNRLGILNLWNPNLKLTYTYKLSSKLYLNVSYQYGYLQYAQPKTVRMLQNGLSVGLGW